MIVGETRTLRHKETGESAFTASSVTCTITKPDGTTTTPSVTVSPGGSATAQTLSAVLTPPDGGEYRVLWSFHSGSDTYKRPETYFCFWTDAPGIVRRKMQKTITTLPDATIEPEIAMVIRRLAAYYPDLPAYADLTGNDRIYVDEAAALFTAARLNPLLAAGAQGALKRVKQGTVDQEFATPKDAEDLDQIWIREGWESLRQVETISGSYDTLKSTFTMFAANGPRRYVESQVGLSNGMNAIFDSFIRELITWPSPSSLI